MASLGTTFNANEVVPSQPFEIIPPGKYRAQVVASEMRPTKDGNGQYLWLELDLLDGEYAGRKLWDRLNLVNANQQAVEIAQRTLSALCHAVGELHVSDSEQLHFRPVVVTVRVRAAREGYEASNEIRGYEPADGSQAATQPQAAKPAAPAARPAAGAGQSAALPPWKQKRSA